MLFILLTSVSAIRARKVASIHLKPANRRQAIFLVLVQPAFAPLHLPEKTLPTPGSLSPPKTSAGPAGGHRSGQVVKDRPKRLSVFSFISVLTAPSSLHPALATDPPRKQC